MAIFHLKKQMQKFDVITQLFNLEHALLFEAYIVPC